MWFEDTRRKLTVGPIKNNTWPLSPVAFHITLQCWFCKMKKNFSIAIPHDPYGLKIIISNNSYKISITPVASDTQRMSVTALFCDLGFEDILKAFHVLLVHLGWDHVSSIDNVMKRLRFSLQVSILQLCEQLFWLLILAHHERKWKSNWQQKTSLSRLSYRDGNF